MYWNGEQGDDRTADGSVSFTYPRHHHVHESRLIHGEEWTTHLRAHSSNTRRRVVHREETIEKSISGK
jgi:hypothetical protein